jgi:hypothetical protein
MSPAEEHAKLHARDIKGEHAAIDNAPRLHALLRRAAQSLQDYCEEVNGDMNDSLAMEIEAFIKGVSRG